MPTKPQPAYVRNRWLLEAGHLLKDATGSANSDWVPVRGLRPITITVTGTLSSGSIRLLVSNSPTPPATSDTNAPQVVDDIVVITSPIVLDAPYNWIRAMAIAVDGPLSVSVMAG